MAVVVGTVLVAVLVNLAVYGVGRLLGGSYRFTSPMGPSEVSAPVVAGFTAVPLVVGLVLAALLARWRWVIVVALVVAPVLALGTIVLATLPADFDTVSTAALALCHVTLVPISVVALLRLRVLATRRARPVTTA